MAHGVKATAGIEILALRLLGWCFVESKKEFVYIGWGREHTCILPAYLLPMLASLEELRLKVLIITCRELHVEPFSADLYPFKTCCTWRPECPVQPIGRFARVHRTTAACSQPSSPTDDRGNKFSSVVQIVKFEIGSDVYLDIQHSIRPAMKPSLPLRPSSFPFSSFATPSYPGKLRAHAIPRTRSVHSTPSSPAKVIPLYGTGPPPDPPRSIAEAEVDERVARRRKQSVLLAKARDIRSAAAEAKSRTKKGVGGGVRPRFWKDVSVQEIDGLSLSPLIPRHGGKP